MGWTKEQQKAIDFKGNLIVSASAGSGKTSTMIARAIRLVTEERVPVERIMLLAYNNAAALELREKLRQGLLNYGKENPLDGMYIREQLDNLYLADISTIHGFCFKLIREFFEEAGASPSIAVQSQEEESENIAKAAKNTLALVEKDVEIRDLMNKYSLKNDDSFISSIISLYNYTTTQADREGFLRDCEDAYLTPLEESATVKFFIGYYQDMAIKYTEYFKEILLLVQEYEKDSIPFVSNIYEIVERCSRVSNLKEYCTLALNPPAFARAKKGELDPMLYDKIIAARDSFKIHYLAKLKGFPSYAELEEGHRLASDHVRLLLKAVRVFEKEYDKLKAEQNRIDFQDMERYAVKLLSDEGLRAEIRDRHDYVFVDEYQDANAVQESIITSVTKEGRLFLVGDVKQSIYRFRLAEPKIFLRTYEVWRKNGNALSFNNNFRSDCGILSFVNDLFENIMIPSFGGIDYKRDGAFVIPENVAVGDIPAVSILSYPQAALEAMKLTAREEKENKVENLYTDENGDSVYDISQNIEVELNEDYNEASIVLDYINKVRGKEVTVKGKKIVVDYRHIAILFQKRGDAKVILSALAAKGIPLNLGSFEGNIGEVQLNVLIDYLSVIDNIYDDYSLITSLHSFIGGFSNNELKDIRLKYLNKMSFAEACLRYSREQDTELAKKLKGFFDKVEVFRFKASFTELSSFIKEVMEGSGYATYVASLENGINIISALNGYIKGLKGKTYARNLSSYLKHFRESDPPELKALSSVENGIVISTLHGSKGLEYPIVILAGLDKTSGGGNMQSILTDRDLGVGFDFFKDEGRRKLPTIDKMAISLKKRLDEKMDKLRLFYVATTRPQSALCIICDVNKEPPFSVDECNCMGDYVRLALSQNESLHNVISYVSPDRLEIEERKNDVTIAEVECPEEVLDVLSFKYPFLEATKTARKYTVSSLNNEDLGYTLSPISVEEERNVLGTAHHAVMQYIDLYADSEEEVKAEIERMSSSGLIDEETARSIDIGEILGCLRSPIIAEARESDCYRERRFVLRKSARDLGISDTDESVLVQGTVDMLIVGERIIVVDFKRSKLSDAKLKERYSTQLKLYGEAVKSTFGRYPDKLLLYVLGRNSIVEID